MQAVRRDFSEAEADPATWFTTPLFLEIIARRIKPGDESAPDWILHPRCNCPDAAQHLPFRSTSRCVRPTSRGCNLILKTGTHWLEIAAGYRSLFSDLPLVRSERGSVHCEKPRPAAWILLFVATSQLATPRGRCPQEVFIASARSRSSRRVIGIGISSAIRAARFLPDIRRFLGPFSR